MENYIQVSTESGETSAQVSEILTHSPLKPIKTSRNAVYVSAKWDRETVRKLSEGARALLSTLT